MPGCRHQAALSGDRPFQRSLEISPTRWLKQERLRSLRLLLLDSDRCIGIPLAQVFEARPTCGTSQWAFNRLYGEAPVHIHHRVHGQQQ